MTKISKLYFKTLTCNLLKLLHTSSYHRSIVFTDADKSKEQNRVKSWHAIIYVDASSALRNKGLCHWKAAQWHAQEERWTYWGFLFLLGRSSLIVCRPTKMWCDSLKSLRKMGEYMSSSFLTSWMKELPDPTAPENTGQTEIKRVTSGKREREGKKT